jgi:hypothetical protein
MYRIDDDSYELLQLDVSEPIVFQGDNKNLQQTFSEKNKQVILLVVPKEVSLYCSANIEWTEPVFYLIDGFYRHE